MLYDVGHCGHFVVIFLGKMTTRKAARALRFGQMWVMWSSIFNI